MKENKTVQLYIKLALTLFFISALYGWLIRYSAVTTLSFFDYAKYLQAHSHVTFLGWGFMSVTSLFNWLFLPNKVAFNKPYKWLFSIEFTSVALMLVSFPLQGYKVFSIVLLSLFLITSYVYVILFYKDFKTQYKDKSIALFIKASLLFYLISSIGIWSIGIVVATQGKTELYYNSIYFYLHFLYNGFFVFALFGLFVHYLKQKEINFSHKKLIKLFWFTFITCGPAYLLSLIKSENTTIVNIGVLAAIVQFISLYYLMGLLKSIKNHVSSNFSSLSRMFFVIILFAYFLKITLQLASAFPQLSQEIVALKSYFVIGYIHLVTLGFVSSMIIWLLLKNNILKSDNKLTKMGLFLFLLGVLTTETVLFTQGTFMWYSKSVLSNYTDLILMSSSILLLGITSLLLSLFLKKRYT